MKKIVLFIFLIVSPIVLGQSAKKVNKQLRAELLVAQQKQDSAYRIFLEEGVILEQVRKDVQSMTRTLLYPEDKKLRGTTSDITASINTLKELEIDTKDVFPEGIDFDSHPKYKTFIQPLSEERDQFVKFDVLSVDYLNLDEGTRKEQNERLEALIYKYETYAKYNQVPFQTQRNYIEQITSFYPRIDSLLRVYFSLSSELEPKSDLLFKKIEVARENYRMKGPKGFSRAYHDQFPDVHPIIAKKIKSIDFETASSDRSGGRDNVGFEDMPRIVAPKVVEEVKEPEIFDVIDEPASFPGGVEAMKTFISKNLKYPEYMKEANIQGKVFLKFIVSETGEISDIKILRGLPDCKECDTEAIRVVKTMPKWIPAKNDGKVVKSYYTLPVSFKLE
jgi:TonB family protein